MYGGILHCCFGTWSANEIDHGDVGSTDEAGKNYDERLGKAVVDVWRRKGRCFVL